MKLANLLKQIPIHQGVTIMEYGIEIAKGHPEYIDVIAHKDKTVGLITADKGRIIINVYDRNH